MHTGWIHDVTEQERIRLNLPKRGGALLLAFLALWLVPEEAHASLALLRIQSLSQSVGGGYHFSNNSTDSGSNASSTRHEFIEDYNVSSDFTLLSPHIVKGSAGLDLRFNQSRETDQNSRIRSSAFDIGYQVSTVMLDRSTIPFTIAANSLIQTQSAPFARTYNLESDDLNMNFSIRNDTLPVRFSVQRNSSLTSGLIDDRRQSMNSYLLTAQHVDGTQSLTRFDLHQTNSKSSLLKSGTNAISDEVGANLSNSINWQDDRNFARTLSSNYAFRKNGGFFPSTSQDVNSNLRMTLGKALSANAMYSYATNRTDSQNYRMQSGSVALTHLLAESISTGVSGSGSNSSFNNGSERSYSGGGSISYQKKLPFKGMFGSSYGVSYSTLDRERQSANIIVENEPHTIPSSDPKRIVLTNPSFRADTVSVRGAQTLTTYTKDLDYILLPEGIEVLPGRMVGDTEVFISYTFVQTPRETFASVSHAAAAKVNLHLKEYFVYANFRFTERQLVSGTASADSLASSSHLDMGCDAHFQRYSLHGEFGMEQNFVMKLDYLEARWLHQREFGSGNLSLSANDRFTWYPQSAGGSSGDWANALNANGTYSRDFTDTVSGRAGLSYLNSLRASQPMSHMLSANLNLDGHFGRTTVTLTSSLNFGIGSQMTQSESVGVSFRRGF
jgi:hypothetical protein